MLNCLKALPVLYSTIQQVFPSAVIQVFLLVVYLERAFRMIQNMTLNGRCTNILTTSSVNIMVLLQY